MKDENGRLLSSDKEQLARCRSHFFFFFYHNLAENAPPLSAEPLRYNNNPRIKEDALSVAQIRDAIKSLSNNTDGIPAEFYKTNSKQSATLLHPLIKDACENENFSIQWIIVKIPKKGDSDNLRGICVLSVVAKIISKIILERRKQHLYSTIDAEQAGFRSGSLTISTRFAS